MTPSVCHPGWSHSAGMIRIPEVFRTPSSQPRNREELAGACERDLGPGACPPQTNGQIARSCGAAARHEQLWQWHSQGFPSYSANRAPTRTDNRLHIMVLQDYFPAAILDRDYLILASQFRRFFGDRSLARPTRSMAPAPEACVWQIGVDSTRNLRYTALTHATRLTCFACVPVSQTRRPSPAFRINRHTEESPWKRSAVWS